MVHTFLCVMCVVQDTELCLVHTRVQHVGDVVVCDVCSPQNAWLLCTSIYSQLTSVPSYFGTLFKLLGLSPNVSSILITAKSSTKVHTKVSHESMDVHDNHFAYRCSGREWCVACDVGEEGHVFAASSEAVTICHLLSLHPIWPCGMPSNGHSYN